MSLRGKRTLVIGGETAIGRAIAVGLAEAGADVVIASLTKDTEAEFTINSVLNELWAIGRRGVALAINASDATEVRDTVARAEAELGGLDAAIAVGEIARLVEAMDGRPVVVLRDDAAPDEALRNVIEKIDVADGA